MKLQFVILCLVSAAVTAPAPAVKRVKDYFSDNVQLLRFENENHGLGDFKFAFEQSDGTKQEQQGEIRNEGKGDETIAIKGLFSWVGPDGVIYTVNYVADNNGYLPEIAQGRGGAVPEDVVASLLG